MASEKFRIEHGLNIDNKIYIIEGTGNPALGAGVAAPLGSFYFESSTGAWYRKTGIGDTNWALGASGPGTDTTAIHSDAASEISAITIKSTPIDGDYLIIEDSADSNNKKSITRADLFKNSITTNGQFISTTSTGIPPFVISSSTGIINLNADLLDGYHASLFTSTGHNHTLGDGAQLDHVNLLNKGMNTHDQIDAHLASSSGIHAISGSVVGTIDSQILSNKTLITPVIDSFENATHDHHNTSTGGILDHINLTNKGTYTHDQLDTHVNNATGVHGVSGNVVGTTDSQVLSNKTLTTPIIYSFQNATHDHHNTSTGGTIVHNNTINLNTSPYYHSDQAINQANSPAWADVTINNLSRSFVTYGSDTKAATGIPWDERGKFKVTVTYSGGNITAAISFVGSNTSFSYYINGKKFTVTATELSAYQATQAAAEGLWFFYINQSTINVASPVMSLSQTPWTIYDPDVLLWNFNFNASTNVITWVGEERHTAGRDIYNHARNHAQGAIYKSGLLFSQYNGLTTFSTNTDNNFGRAQVQISGGAFYDEDILNNIVHTDASISSTTASPATNWNLTVNQFLGFTALATIGTNNTTIVFTTSRTLVTGQAITVMQGNTTTVRGTTTISSGGTGTTFTVTSVTGLTAGDAIVVGARIPIYYIDSVAGGVYTWRKLLPTTDFVGVSAGAPITAATIATATCQYNNPVTGGWTNMTANRYFPVYLCATNLTSEPIIAIFGQSQSNTSTLATTLGESGWQFNNLAGLAYINLQEIVPFYRLTFHYNTTAGFNANRMRLVDATFLNIRVATVSGSVLGSPITTISASMVNTDTTNFSGILSTADTTVQAALDTIDDYLITPQIQMFYQNITQDFTIPEGQNGLSVGPVEIEEGYTVTISDGSYWTVV